MPFWRSVHRAKVPFWRSVHRAKVPFSDGTLPFWKPGQNTVSALLVISVHSHIIHPHEQIATLLQLAKLVKINRTNYAVVRLGPMGWVAFVIIICYSDCLKTFSAWTRGDWTRNKHSRHTWVLGKIIYNTCKLLLVRSESTLHTKHFTSVGQNQVAMNYML